jgi:hypothetical protein
MNQNSFFNYEKRSTNTSSAGAYFKIMKTPPQEYFECERFTTDECPQRKTDALKKREILINGDYETVLNQKPDTFEELIELRQICGRCKCFVQKDSEK